MLLIKLLLLLSLFSTITQGEYRTYVLGYPGPTISSDQNSWEEYNMGAFRGAVYFYFSSFLTSPIGVEIIPFRMDAVWLSTTSNLDNYLDGIFWTEVPEIATHPNGSVWVSRVVDFFLSGGDLFLAQDFNDADLIGEALGVPDNVSVTLCTGACLVGEIVNAGSPFFQGPFGEVIGPLFAEGGSSSLPISTNGTLDVQYTAVNPGNIQGPLILRWEKDQYRLGAGRMVILGDGDMINTQCTASVIIGYLNDNGRFALNMLSWLVGGPALPSSSSSSPTTASSSSPPKASAQLPQSEIAIQVDFENPLAGGLQIFPTSNPSESNFQLVIDQLVETNPAGAPVATAAVPLFSSDRFSVSEDDSIANRSSITLQTDLVVHRIGLGSTFAHLLVRFVVFGAPEILTFAGIQFPVDPTIMKFTIEISNWPFQSMSNQLVMTLEIQGNPPFLPTSLTLSPDTPVQQTSTYYFASPTIQGSLMLVDVITKDGEPDPVDIVHAATLDSLRQLKLTVLFPSFEFSLAFDPNLQVLPLGDQGDGTSEDSGDSEETTEEKEGGDGDVTTWIFVSLLVAFIVLSIVLGTGLVIMFLSYRMRMKRLSQLSKSNTQMVSF